MRSLPLDIPAHGRALLQALQFREPDQADLLALNDAQWHKLLHLADDVQLTLTLRHYCRDAMPEWVRGRVDKDSQNNLIRFENASAILLELAAEFDSRGIDYTVLKGFTHSPHFTPDPTLRAQSDCDLWLAREAIPAAHAAISEIGYVPICASNSRHISPMVRPSPWTWTGDYFAPDLPISVDLHYELWDENAEKIGAPGEKDFWPRRISLPLKGRPLPALCLEDTLAFAALHILIHLFHGDLRLHRAWEIAHFLHHHRDDAAFWNSWSTLHPPELRRLQAVVFALVAKWFGCGLAAEAEQEIAALPSPVQSWIKELGWSPIQGLFKPNRDELWLHLALINSRSDKWRVFLYRLLPLRKPGQMMPGNMGNDPRLRFPNRLKQFAKKAVRHMKSFAPTLAKGATWWWCAQGFEKGFLVYLAGSALFDAGAFIFVLLYNLFLLDHGYREQVIGQVNAAMTAGTLCAALPAAWVFRRFGLRSSILIAIVGVACAAGLRAVANDPLSLMITAFLHGLFFSVWAVCYSPTIAAFTNDRNRTLGFSITFGMGMSLGIGAGFVGGRLPALFRFAGLSHDALSGKRFALIAAAALILVAALPISRLVVSPKPQEPARESRRIYPRSAFFGCFLLIALVWSLATSAFNPFFNTYFVDRYHMSVERIGAIFSLSQMVQVIAVCLAPVVLRWMGNIKGIALLQLMAACMMALLMPRFPMAVCALVFIAYMSFQYMTGPSLFSLIMSHVSKEEQSGASALNFVVTSLAAVAASFAAGAIIHQRGYPQLLAVSALLALCTAILTWTLLPASHRPPKPFPVLKTKACE